ncbi:hypothetical protein BGZ80_001962 [Entomortierella chlamydospora]|uniref:Uncharacterized protein n=1 Tax=Entomortierella chlamydospora TaxID=101097 RepID=A0A9P6T3T8_9FUNG|nr:hypothetical protein BGZ79_003412 [Entomortierella chlamydospora]KAG0021654.1 hypothetical protein BGZ80_001962 [Entomortierella chlamydospora]
MNPTRSSYVEYGTGNMLNIDAGTIKRKIDSNEYDDEIIQEVQPNGKRACSLMNHPQQFATFGTPITPNGPETHNFTSSWPQSNQASLPHNGFGSNDPMHGYHTPESNQSSGAASPFDSSSSMDMDMESVSAQPDSSAMVESASAVLNAAVSAPMSHQSSGLLPSALPEQISNNESSTEYVPVHGRSMEIPSYARVPLNEVRKYRDQKWSSCIYGADTRIGQGMMI